MDNMQQPSMPPAGQGPEMSGVGREAEEKSMGALIGSIIIVIILVVGGLYLWSSKMQEEGTLDDSGIKQGVPDATMPAPPAPPAPPTTPAAAEDGMTTKLNSQGSSDELGAIETDLNATNLDGADAEMGTI